MNLVRIILLSVICGVFAVAAVTKIIDPAAFLDAAKTYRILPPLAAVMLAVWLPWLELTAAVCLWVKPLRSAALAIVATATFVFMIALAQAWFRGIDIHCGCFGRSAAASEHGYLIYFSRDLLILAAVLVSLVLEKKSASSR